MNEIENKLLLLTKEIVSDEIKNNLSLSTKLNELDIDSLGTVEYLVEINKEFEIDIPVSVYMDCQDLQSLSIAIKELNGI